MTSDMNISSLPKDLQKKVKEMIVKYPETASLIGELLDKLQPELSHKKSKLEASSKDLGEPLIGFPDLSFQMPIRKKAKMILYESALCLMVGDSTEFILNYNDILRIFCLHTPNKGKPHYTWLIVPKNKADHKGDCSLPADTILWAFDDIMPKFKLDTKLNIPGNSVNELVAAALYKQICLDSSIEICTPEPEVFSSSDTIDYNHEPVFYINCYDRAKEGHLYFFDFGIFWGFKKPLMFYSSQDIQKVEIVGMTGRFFNLHIILKSMDADDFIEYSMIGAPEQKGVAAYINKFFPPKGKGKAVAAPSSSKPATASSIMAAELPQSDEEDEDFAINSDDENGLAEEYDSGHETDTGSTSISLDSDDGENDDDEEERDDSQDEQNEEGTEESEAPILQEKFEKGKPGQKISQSQAQREAITKQMQQRKPTVLKSTAKVITRIENDDDEEEDIASESEILSGDEQEEYETEGSEELVDEDDDVEVTGEDDVEDSHQTEVDELE